MQDAVDLYRQKIHMDHLESIRSCLVGSKLCAGFVLSCSLHLEFAFI